MGTSTIKLTEDELLTFQQFDSLPNDTLVRKRVVRVILGGVSDSALWRRAKAGEIPQPVQINCRAVAWRVGDLRDYIRSLSVAPAAK